MLPKMPVLFVGHGSPMNAVEDNQYTAAWKVLGEKLPRPKAILMVSAHWLTQGTKVHETKHPNTIHDFWGFPEPLYQIQYPCPGAVDVANLIKVLVKKTKIDSDTEWGIDHGAWVPLRYLFPKADVPIVQLSIDASQPASFHYQLGKELAPLREQNILIIASGNIVHNLGMMRYEPEAKPFSWAEEYDEVTKQLLFERDHEPLIKYERLGNAAALSIPTPEHYWPLLYAIALQEKEDAISFPVTGIAYGSISMRAIAIGMSEINHNISK